MPLLDDKKEKEIKGEGMIRLREGVQQIRFLSNLYRIDSHYVEEMDMSILCQGAEKCFICSREVPKQSRFYYYIKIKTADGLQRDGIALIDAPVFYEIADRVGKDESKRDYVWEVKVTPRGEDQAPDYKVDKAGEVSSELTDKQKEKYNKILEEDRGEYEQFLNERYKEHIEPVVEGGEEIPEEEVVPPDEGEEDDIPF